MHCTQCQHSSSQVLQQLYTKAFWNYAQTEDCSFLLPINLSLSLRRIFFLLWNGSQNEMLLSLSCEIAIYPKGQRTQWMEELQNLKDGVQWYRLFCSRSSLNENHKEECGEQLLVSSKTAVSSVMMNRKARFLWGQIPSFFCLKNCFDFLIVKKLVGTCYWVISIGQANYLFGHSFTRLNRKEKNSNAIKL